MAKHEIAGKWSSFVSRGGGPFGGDVLGDFDLTNLESDGNPKNCLHKDKKIVGHVDTLDIPPVAFTITFDQFPVSGVGFEQHYRGVAIRDLSTKKITTIVGFSRGPSDLPLKKGMKKAKGKAAAAAAADQDEATWVATKQP
jgi:hypothetical protein